MEEQRRTGWARGAWLNPPAHTESDGTGLLVVTGDRTGFRRTTSFGFVRDDGHALPTGFAPGSAVEVTFIGAADTSLHRTWTVRGPELRHPSGRGGRGHRGTTTPAPAVTVSRVPRPVRRPVPLRRASAAGRPAS